MDEVKEDVISEPSTEEVVKPDSETTTESSTQSSTELSTEAETSTQEVKPEVKDNRPIENVAWESKRKVDELYSVVNEMKQMLQQNQSHTPQQPQYSKAQLQAYASDPSTTTEQRLWAYTEVDKIERTDRQKEYESLVTQTREKTDAENRRNQSAGWVAQSFPDLIVKDGLGNPMGWNQGHPLLMRANEYMSRSKSLRDDPEGFAAAVKLAAFDLGVSVNKQMNQKLDRTIGQLRKEQKKQLASTGGTQVKENPEALKTAKMAKLQKLYADTGDKNVFADILKLRGGNPFAK